MKPRNQRERDVVTRANSLPPITDAQRKWAIDNLFHKDGLYLKSGEIFCQHCGHLDHVLVPVLAVSIECNHICPNCGISLTLKHAPRMKRHQGYSEICTYGIMSRHGDDLLTRVFEVHRINRYGEPTQYKFNEVWQSWVDKRGVEKLTGRPYSRSAYHLTWRLHEFFDIKTHNSGGHGYYQYEDLFDDNGVNFYPRHSVIPELKRNGWEPWMIKSFCPVSFAKMLLKSNTAETMLKSGQLNVFKWMVNRSNYEVPHLPSIRICNRNGYIIEDPKLYFDYLDMLAEDGRDLRNAHYVCPPDLKEAHDRVMARINRKREAERMRKRIAEARDHEAAYLASKGKYFGICFGNEHIVITVIASVAEMAEEGKAMHHCVYAAKYYEKPNSLILSAKDTSGNRIETIELNLKTLKVEQSRGVHNSKTPYHEEILKLVKDNIHLIAKAA